MSDERQSEAGADLTRLASVNLNLLVPLFALLEERSVTRAAARVGLSQSAMSHALARMRRLFDDELLVRRGDTSVLTPRALEMLEPLRQALLQTASVVSPADFDPATTERVITVPMTVNAAFVMGSRLSILLAEQSPKATLRLRAVMSASEESFTDNGFDLMLISDEFSAPYPRERLYEDRWVVITSGRAPAEASPLELLTTLPHVALDVRPQRHPYATLSDHGVPFTIRDYVSDSLLIPQQVAYTGGVAVHEYRVAAVMQTFFDLRIEEFPFPTPTPSVDIVWNPWLADEPFKQWIRSILFSAVAHAPSPPREPGT